MTPCRNQRLEPQKSLVRLVQMMIFLFKKKNGGIFRVLSEPSPFHFFVQCLPTGSLLNWFEGMWNTRHPPGGKPLQGPWGVTPTTLFFARGRNGTKTSSLIALEIYKCRKNFARLDDGNFVNPKFFSHDFISAWSHHHFYSFKNWLFRVPTEGLRINMTGAELVFFR